MGFLRKISFVFVFLGTIFSLSWCEEISPSIPTQNEKEDLFLRRMIDFWEEGEHQMVQIQIEKYLKEEEQSKSPFSNYLRVLLGDIYMDQKKYEQAFVLYQQISETSLKEKIFCNFLQCLYETRQYAVLEKECQTFLKEKSLEKEETLRPVHFFLGQAYYQQGSQKGEEGEKKEILLKAKKEFTVLLDQKEFAKPSLQNLARIEHLLHEDKLASELYLELGKKYPEEQEAYFFQAALSQAEFDKELAIHTFGQIAREGKKKVWESAYNRVLLLLETGKYSEVVLSKDSLYGLIPENKIPFLYFIVGKSHFMLEDYKRAVVELKKYVNCEERGAPEMEQALDLLVQCAQKQEELELFDQTILHLEVFYQKSAPLLQKALFARALLEKKKELFEKALADFERLDKEGYFLEGRAHFLFEQAHLFFQVKEWKKSREKFLVLIREQKDNPLVPLCWNYLIEASFRDAPQGEVEKKIFLSDLEQILKEGSWLPLSERQEYIFLSAHTKFELKNYEGTFDLLFPFLEEKSLSSQRKAQVEMLLALCYKNQGENLEKFCQYAEQALQTDASNFLKHSVIKLSLFNAYLVRAKQDPKFFDLAADYLYEAQRDSEPVLLENLLWLAEHDYKKVLPFLERKEESKEALQIAERALSVFQKILTQQVESSFKLSEKTLFLESPLIEMTSLLGFLGKKEQERFLLEQLIEQYEKNPSYQWEHREKALFAMALFCEEKGEAQKALQYFEKISQQGKHPYFLSMARLHETRVRLASIRLEDFHFQNELLVKELNQLKDLKLQKRLISEPAHLEAALDSADLQSELEKPQSQEKKLSLLLKIKEDFSSEEDLLSKDYHKSFEALPEKKELFDAYMRMIDFEIFLYQGSSVDQKEKWRDEAKKKMEEILLQKSLKTSYLQMRMEKNRKFLEKSF